MRERDINGVTGLGELVHRLRAVDSTFGVFRSRGSGATGWLSLSERFSRLFQTIGRGDVGALLSLVKRPSVD
jgi:photosystem II stability/assembly factor-like uncharacterized protein